MKYVSIDLETTGTDPATCQILEIGAVVQELGGEELDRYSVILQYEQLTGSPYALWLNHELIKKISKGEGLRPDIAFRDFHTWIGGHYGSGHTWEEEGREYGSGLLVVAGKNVAGFDIPFFKHYYPSIANLFHRRTLDPCVLYMRSDDIIPPSLSTCLERAGMSNVVTHNAMEDAEQVRDLIEHHFNR